MHWATAISQAARIEDAADDALESIADDLGAQRPDIVFAFVGADYLSHASRLGPHIAQHCPDAAIVGCSASGVVGGGHEIEHERALSLTAAVAPGVTATPFHLAGDPATWRQRIGESRDEETRAVLVFPDPFTCPTEDLLDWLDTTFPPTVTTKVGGLASGGVAPGSVALFSGRDTVHTGAVGLTLAGNIEVDTVVAQGCRPIATPIFATRVEDNLIFELDGQPALLVLESLYNQLSGSNQQLFRHSLFLGVVMEPDKQEYGHGDFLIRNIVGVDPDARAIVVAAKLTHHQVVQFHLRDALTSAEDLHNMLSSHPRRDVRGGLMFSCVGRGTGLYGRPDHDSEVFADYFGDVPLGGFFCNGEIGPVGPRTFLHGYTSSFALFRPR